MKNIISKYENFFDSFFDFFEKYYWIFFIILSCFISFLCFHNLGVSLVQDWDEARHGVSAYEMLKNNEYIINTYNYSNDYWNLKPPLSFLGIILSFKILGVSVFSFRFTSAISLLLTAIIVSIFIKNRYGKLESLILLATFSCISPFFLSHMGRSGDADSLFMLLFTLAMLYMLKIVQKKYALYLCGFFFSLAFLTKSWHAFAIVAIGGLYLLFTGLIKNIKFKEWIYFLLSFIIPLGTWASLRLIKDGPKFLIEMVRYDLLERSSTSLEGHTGTVWFYFDYLFLNNKFLMVFIITIILIGIGFYNNRYSSRKNDVLGFFLWIAIPFALFTKAETKIFWYIIPILVPLAMLSSIFLGKFIREKTIPVLLRSVLVIIFCATILFYGINMIKSVINVSADSYQYFMLDDVSRYDEIKGFDAYIDLDDNEGNWRQSQLFLAEISADLKCQSGGLNAFLESTNPSVLIISTNNFNENISLLKNTTIIYNNDELYLISKN